MSVEEQVEEAPVVLCQPEAPPLSILAQAFQDLATHLCMGLILHCLFVLLRLHTFYPIIIIPLTSNTNYSNDFISFFFINIARNLLFSILNSTV